MRDRSRDTRPPSEQCRRGASTEEYAPCVCNRTSTWNTEEVLAMVEWMREHNARSEHKIHFTGFDMQTPDVAAAEVDVVLNYRR